MTSLQYTILSVFIVSLVSLAGVLFLSFKTSLLKKMLMYLVSFSTGALLGNVFLHLIPEVIAENQENLVWVLMGILLSFVIEKFIHWRHCHDLECATHVHPVGPLVIMGDAVHNVLDGILIATAYLVSIPVGISTTIAVLLHEIPQELGDFAILIHSGMSKSKALLFNFFSALTAFIGVAIVISLSQSIANIEMILLPLAAGNFLYIAGSDLIPELHKETRIKNAAIQLLMMMVGIGLMYGLSSNQHGHAEERGHHEEEIHEEHHE